MKQNFCSESLAVPDLKEEERQTKGMISQVWTLGMHLFPFNIHVGGIHSQ